MADPAYLVMSARPTRPGPLPGPLPAPPRRPPRQRRPRARHRLGAPGLRHSRELCAIPGGRRKPRHAMPVPPRQRHIRSATLFIVAGTVLISGWFAAAGAVAFAEMLGP